MSFLENYDDRNDVDESDDDDRNKDVSDDDKNEDGRRIHELSVCAGSATHSAG